MRRGNWLALGTLLGGLSLGLLFTAPAHSQKAPKKEETLIQRLARKAKLSEDNAQRFMDQLGPALSDELKNGKTVIVAGLGTFRVVRIAEHKDMQIGTGRPLTVPAINTVEFLAEASLKEAANSDKAQPAETVQPFQYNPLPNQTPGQKVGRTHTPSTRNP